MDNTLRDITRLSETARTLEDLARGVLTLLGEAGGFECVYLVQLVDDQGTATVTYARNTQREVIEIPEDLTLPWTDTQCSLAVRDGIPFTHRADEQWPRVKVADGMPIASYLVVPLEDLDGRLLGALCAASHRVLPVGPEAVPLHRLCARLLAHQFAQDRAAGCPPASARTPRARVLDALTGLPDRRTLVDDLAVMLRTEAGEGGLVCVAFITFGGFEDLLARHGPEAGDHFLVTVARRLAAVVGTDRKEGFAARFGADEFVVAASIPRPLGNVGVTRLFDRLTATLAEPFALGPAGDGAINPLADADARLATVLAQPGETSLALLQRADDATYEVSQNMDFDAQRAAMFEGPEAGTDAGADPVAGAAAGPEPSPA